MTKNVGSKKRNKLDTAGMLPFIAAMQNAKGMAGLSTRGMLTSRSYHQFSHKSKMFKVNQRRERKASRRMKMRMSAR